MAQTITPIAPFNAATKYVDTGTQSGLSMPAGQLQFSTIQAAINQLIQQVAALNAKVGL